MKRRIIVSIIALTLSHNVIAKEDFSMKSILVAMAKVETNNRDIVGDKHLKNKAYGVLQMRQPAVDDVNRIYGFSGVHKANDLKGNRSMQFKYAELYLNILIKEFNGNKKLAIMAYNLGIKNVKNGKRNDYYNKVKKHIKGDR